MARVPAPNPKHLEFLSPFDPRVVKLALATRALVLRAAPHSTELIYDAFNAVATGYSFTGRPSDAFIHIAVYSKWVNLGFNFGSQFEDPGGVLQGSGRWVRHIRISGPADLKNPALGAFVKTAVSQAERPAAKLGKNAVASVVRAVYPSKRRPRLTG